MFYSPAVAYYVNNIFKCKYPSSRGWNGPPKNDLDKANGKAPLIIHEVQIKIQKWLDHKI